MLHLATQISAFERSCKLSPSTPLLVSQLAESDGFAMSTIGLSAVRAKAVAPSA